MFDFFHNVFYIFFPVSGITLLWFFSPLKCTIAKLYFKQDIIDNEDFEQLLIVKGDKYLAKLSGCIYCVFFWICFLFCLVNYTDFKNFIVLFFTCNYFNILLNKYVYGL